MTVPNGIFCISLSRLRKYNCCLSAVKYLAGVPLSYLNDTRVRLPLAVSTFSSKSVMLMCMFVNWCNFIVSPANRFFPSSATYCSPKSLNSSMSFPVSVLYKCLQSPHFAMPLNEPIIFCLRLRLFILASFRAAFCFVLFLNLEWSP